MIVNALNNQQQKYESGFCISDGNTITIKITIKIRFVNVV